MSRSSALDRAMAIPGALAVSMVDLDTGASLGVTGPSAHLADSWAGLACALVRASKDTVDFVDGERGLEELVITGIRSFHLLRLVPSAPNAHQVAIHVTLDRSLANLAMARLDLKAIAEQTQDCGADPPRPPSQQTTVNEAVIADVTSARGSPSHVPEAHGDEALSPLPRRSPNRTLSQESLTSSVEFSLGELARIPGTNVRPPDTETLRRVARALRELR